MKRTAFTMATSLSRRNRRRRKAAGLVAVGAAGALLASGLVPAQANALDIPLVATCSPGELDEDGISFQLPLLPPLDFTATADCTRATDSILATIGDAIIGVILPDLPFGLSTFNGAIATPGVGTEELGGIIDVAWPIAGNATIEGTGYNTAIVLLGGDATAKSDYYAAGAIAIASMGGQANSDALFGGALSMALSVPLLAENSADARALPLGIAIANSSNPIKGVTANATALGGIASASSTLDQAEDAVCTAAYGQASLTDSDGKNIKSCTSVLFIFQQYQDGEGPVWYAIKNPFDINLVSPFGDNIADLLAAVGDLITGGNLPEPVIQALAGKFVPEFGSDVVRISFDGGSPQVETDLPDWIAGLLDSNNTNSLLSTSGTQVQNQADDEPTVVAASVDDSVEAAPLQVNDPAPIADTVVEDPAPLPELTFNEPKVEEPAVEAPATEEPVVEAPAASEAEEAGPAQEAPALDGVGADSAEGVDSDADLVLN